MKRKIKVPLPNPPKKLGVTLAEKKVVQEALQAVLDLNLPEDPETELGSYPLYYWDRINEVHSKIIELSGKLEAADRIMRKYSNRHVPKAKAKVKK